MEDLFVLVLGLVLVLETLIGMSVSRVCLLDESSSEPEDV